MDIIYTYCRDILSIGKIITRIATLASISGYLLASCCTTRHFILLSLPGSVLLHVGSKLGLLFRSFLKVCVMPLEVSPQSSRLFESFRALRTLEVIGVRVEHLVLLQRPGGEEPLAAGRTEEGAGHLLLGLVGVEGDHVSLEIGRHPHSLPAQVTVGVLSLGMFDHVQLQLVFEVEDLVTNLAVQFSTDFVF